MWQIRESWVAAFDETREPNLGAPCRWGPHARASCTYWVIRPWTATELGKDTAG
jgi:hypothetical protein